TALGDGVDLVAAGPAVFRPVAERRYLDFRNRFAADASSRTVDSRTHRCHAVNHVVVEAAAADTRGRSGGTAAAGVELTRQRGIIEEDARHECEQGNVAPLADRQCLSLFRLD